MTTLITASQNLAGNNATGIKTAKKRATMYAAARHKTPVDLICLQETTVAAGIRPTLDKLLASKYRRSGGGKGRYIYTAHGLTVIASGLITTKKSTWWKNDDKQAAWVVFEKHGVRGLDVTYHLESDPTARKARFAQITDIVYQGEALAAKYQVNKANILWTGDANSTTQIDAFLRGRGYPNAAEKTPWHTTPTLIGWNGKGTRRVDYAHGLNATLVALSANPELSDHAGLRVRRTLTKDTPMASVRELQEILNSLGFYCGRADGLIGARTRGAIHRFQAAWNLGPALTVDGIAGPKTLAALKITSDSGGRLSEHFTAAEFVCQCFGKNADCLGIVAYRADLAGLEQLRKAAYQSGLRIVSAYRCSQHNKAEGGATSSQHLQGKAFDIPAVVTVGSASIPARFKGQGYNKSTRKVRHVDSRPNTARWEY